MVKDQTHGDCLQKIALRLLSITPHSVMPERLFSILDWQHSKRRNRLSAFTLESIAKIHTYYNNDPPTGPIDATLMEEALIAELEVQSVDDSDPSGRMDSDNDNASVFFREMSENQVILRALSESEELHEGDTIEDHDLLQLDQVINIKDRDLRAVLVDVGLIDAMDSAVDQEEDSAMAEDKQDESDQDYDVNELLANAIDI
jgi:hypothetical protein